jgi:hypothetical protein
LNFNPIVELIQYHGSEHDHDHLWIKDVPIHENYTNEEIEKIHFM